MTTDLRPRLHAMWASVAGFWATYADELDAMRADVTAAMLDRAHLAPGQRVLETACGPGGVGLAAATLVQPGGQVVLTDVAVEMTAVAAARAASRELGNVATRVGDLEDLAEPACAYDVVLCREGLMFAADPGLALREMRRVLRPGGTAVLAVWGPREENPWLGLLFDAVGASTGHPVPPAGVPGPFSLSDTAGLLSLIETAGFVDVSVTALPTPTRAHTFDAWWTRTSSLAGPLAGVLAGLPDPARDALRARLRGTLAKYTDADGRLDIPGLTLVCSMRRSTG